jgi:predicted Zn-dependent protease
MSDRLELRILPPMIGNMTFHRSRPLASTTKFCLSWMTLGAVILVLAFSSPARAISLLRDADMEFALKQVATPILRAAGLSPARVKILVVDDPNLNAFVVSNDAIFIHAGLISRLNRAEALQGVIAHEAAHIANGHITRRLTNLGAARTAAGLGTALAAIAAAAGGAEAGAAVALGTRSSAERAFLRHTRAEESSADQSALRYMSAAGVDPKGMLDVLDLFRGQDALSERRQDAYVRSHPLTRDRYRAVSAYAQAVGNKASNAQANYWYQRAKGKLTAYKRAPRWTLTRAGESGHKDIALMRQAIAHHRNSNTKRALSAIDKAISLRPNDAYFLDLRGEILMGSRNFAAAAQTYGRAVKRAPRDGLILAGYGRALLATGQIKAARSALEKARAIDFRDGIMLRDLAQAYAKSGQTGMAALVTAERYALRGQLKNAGIHAKRATDLLSEGSGPWQRAQDVLLASQRAARKRR